jgi:hypothetical protein
VTGHYVGQGLLRYEAAPVFLAFGSLFLVETRYKDQSARCQLKESLPSASFARTLNLAL